jgi:hypothetical protein
MKRVSLKGRVCFEQEGLARRDPTNRIRRREGYGKRGIRRKWKGFFMKKQYHEPTVVSHESAWVFRQDPRAELNDRP